MYKLYMKVNGAYKNPKLCKSYEEAKRMARDSYLIIEEDENGTHRIIEQNEKIVNREDDDER